MKILLVTALAIFLLWTSCDQPDKKDKMIQKGQTVQKLDKEVTLKAELDYYLYLPEEYDENSSKKWPLLLFLHGSGERGNTLEKIKAWGVPKFVEEMKLPFITISPQCPEDEDWSLESLYALLQDIEENYHVDTTREYLTGLSMGGFATWEMAIKYPEKFAAIAPLSAGGRTFRTKKLVDVPVWAFHGAKDEVVLLKEGQAMVDALNKAGGNAKMTVFPELGHVSWDTVYTDTKFYDWLLEHQLKEK